MQSEAAGARRVEQGLAEAGYARVTGLPPHGFSVMHRRVWGYDVVACIAAADEVTGPSWRAFVRDCRRSAARAAGGLWPWALRPILLFPIVVARRATPDVHDLLPPSWGRRACGTLVLPGCVLQGVRRRRWGEAAVRHAVTQRRVVLRAATAAAAERA